MNCDQSNFSDLEPIANTRHSDVLNFEWLIKKFVAAIQITSQGKIWKISPNLTIGGWVVNIYT